MSSSLFGLPISWTADWIFNSYVLHDADDLVVVDPGLKTVANQVVDLVRGELDRDPADIGSVLCTHGHSDHVGGVSTLLDHCGADVHLPGRCESYLAGERPRNFPMVASTVRFLGVYAEQEFSLGALRAFAATAKLGYGGQKDMSVDFDPAGFLVDGDQVPHAPGWEVLSTPGHTDDSTCFYHAETATLISGDAVVCEDGTPWFNPEFIDINEATETAERLLSLEVRHLLPGHGKPIEAPNVWARAKQPLDKPTGGSMLARCSRRFGRWR